MTAKTKYWRPYSNLAAFVRFFIPDLSFRLKVGERSCLEASIQKHLGLFRPSVLQRELSIAGRILACAPRDAVIYDLGANIGLYTLVFAQDASTRVMSFEPSELALPFLRRNVALNGLGNIEIHPVLLSDHAGRCRFALDRVTTATSHVAEAGEPGIDLACSDLDSYVESNRLAPPDVIKIDVEGHERQIIAGMRGLIMRYRPTIFVEGGLREPDGKIGAAVDLMKHGYEIWNLDRTSLLPPDTPEYSFLAVRPR